MLSWLHSQIPVMWQPCSLLTKKQEYAMTICTVDVHKFSAPKLDWNLTKLERMCWIPGKTLHHLVSTARDASDICR